MKTVHLQVQDDFLEDLLSMLPKDKVRVLDQNFLDTQKKFQAELENFKNKKDSFPPYHEDMKEMDNWLKDRGEKI